MKYHTKIRISSRLLNQISWGFRRDANSYGFINCNPYVLWISTCICKKKKKKIMKCNDVGTLYMYRLIVVKFAIWMYMYVYFVSVFRQNDDVKKMRIFHTRLILPISSCMTLMNFVNSFVISNIIF